MKKYLIYVILFVSLSGCATAKLPAYIQDKNPYKMTFYKNYDFVYDKVLDLLLEDGWEVFKTADPLDFEFHNHQEEASNQQILVMTEPRKNKLLLGVSAERVNIYIRRASQKVTNVEVRYLGTTTLKLKTIFDYKDDKYVSQFFIDLGQRLKK